MAADFKISTTSKFIIMTAVMASLLEIIDTSIVNVAIPTMMGNLGATLEDISWVVTGYIIANAIILPLSAWLASYFGRRKYYIGCILIFTMTSVACGMAPNLEFLVIFRIIQGLAGGALLPTSQALIQEQFPRERAGAANAIFGMSVMIGPTLGPTLGGYLTDNFGWRSIFNINLPLGLATALLASIYVTNLDPLAHLSETAKKAAASVKKTIDVVGLGLLAVGIGCLQYVLERGQADEWFDSMAIRICTFLAIAAIPTLIWWELQVENPVINVRLYKHRVLRLGAVLGLELGVVLYGLIFVIPVFAARVLNYDATQTGMVFIPGALLTAACMPVVGKLLRKYDPRWIIAFGITVLECALLMFTSFSTMTGGSQVFWALLVRGLAMAFLFVPLNTVVLGEFRGAELGQAAGLQNLFRQLGGSVGIAIMSTLLDRMSAQNYADMLPHLNAVNPIAQMTLARSKMAMAHTMLPEVGMGGTAQAALKALSFRVSNQVFVMSFEQLMWILCLSFALAYFPLKFFKGTVNFRGPVVDAH